MENLAALVEATVRYCLYLDEEVVDHKPPADAIIVDAITTKIAFNPVRIIEKHEQIREMLDEMAPAFHKDTGGGMSFLNLCNDKHGEQWTGFHQSMAMLVALGLATGMAKYTVPREMWSAMPGGMPYVTIDTTGRPVRNYLKNKELGISDDDIFELMQIASEALVARRKDEPYAKYVRSFNEKATNLGLNPVWPDFDDTNPYPRFLIDGKEYQLPD